MINRKTALTLFVLVGSLIMANSAITQSESALEANIESEFDALFADDEEEIDSDTEIDIDELAEDDSDDSVEEEESMVFEDPRLPSEDRAAAGGWYLDEFQIRYRPTDHADRFVKAWVDVSSEQSTELYANVFKSISDESTPGSCFKCHSIDKVENGAKVNWRVRQSDPQIHEFNKFSHVAHFNLLDQDGCSTCHAFDKESDFAKGFEDQDPLTFASNFKSISQQTCTQCHQEDKVGETCLTCHSYHIGSFAPTVESEGQLSTGE